MRIEGTIFLTLAGILFTLDIISTVYILAHRQGSESNPLVRWLIAKLGLRLALVLSKAVALVLCLASAFYAPVWILCALLVFYTWVVSHNVRQLL